MPMKDWNLEAAEEAGMQEELRKMNVNIGDKVRFIHSSNKGIDRILTGKIKEHIGDAGELIEVYGDTAIKSLDGTLCHRNKASIIEVI